MAWKGLPILVLLSLPCASSNSRPADSLNHVLINLLLVCQGEAPWVFHWELVDGANEGSCGG
eukprot:8101166-Prorocentrum_lima.AAC.1